MLAHLADLAHDAHGALVLGVVLGPVKRALLERGAAVDRRVAGRANLEFGKLVKLDLDCVVRVPLALRLCLAGLSSSHVSLVNSSKLPKVGLTLSKSVLAPPLASILLAKLSAEL